MSATVILAYEEDLEGRYLLLVPPDFPEGDCTRPVPVGLLDTSRSLGRRLSSSLGSDCSRRLGDGVIGEVGGSKERKGEHGQLRVGRWGTGLDSRCFLGALPPVDFRAVCCVVSWLYACAWRSRGGVGSYASEEREGGKEGRLGCGVYAYAEYPDSCMHEGTPARMPGRMHGSRLG